MLSSQIDSTIATLFLKAAEFRAKGHEIGKIVELLGSEGSRLTQLLLQHPEEWARMVEIAIRDRVTGCMLEALGTMQQLLSSTCEKTRQKAGCEIIRVYMFQNRSQSRRKPDIEQLEALVEAESQVPQPEPVMPPTPKTESFSKSQAKKMFAASLNTALNGHAKR